MPGKVITTVLKFSVLTVLLAATAGACYALEEIEIVTRERAKELGLEIRSNAAGPDAVLVVLEFEKKGELKDYFRVALEMDDEGRLLLSSTLREEKSEPGRVVVSFAADRTKLDKFTLKVVAFSGGSRVGHVIPIKDFVDLTKIR